MVAAKDQRKSTFGQGVETDLVNLVAGAGNFSDVFFAVVACTLGLRNWRGYVTFVNEGSSERQEALGETSNPDGRRAHVDPSASSAEV